MPEEPQENKLKHPCFPQVDDESARVWRYMDLAKFVWLIENQSLFLPRLDLLNDPHEGSIPPFIVKARNEQLLGMNAEKFANEIRDINQQTRRAIFVSCWNLGNDESEAMWLL